MCCHVLHCNSAQSGTTAAPCLPWPFRPPLHQARAEKHTKQSKTWQVFKISILLLPLTSFRISWPLSLPPQLPARRSSRLGSPPYPPQTASMRAATARSHSVTSMKRHEEAAGALASGGFGVGALHLKRKPLARQHSRFRTASVNPSPKYPHLPLLWHGGFWGASPLPPLASCGSWSVVHGGFRIVGLGFGLFTLLFVVHGG